MSEIISFRLNRNNPREERALAVLTAKQEAGFGIRQVLVEALLMLAGEADSGLAPVVNDLQAVLEEARSLVGEMRSGHAPVAENEAGGYAHKAQLSDGFLVSVKNAARPGMKGG